MPPIGAVEQTDRATVGGAAWTPPGGPSATGGPPGGSEFVVARYRRRGEDIADANGVAVVNLGASPLESWWLVGRLLVRSNSAAASEVQVFVGEITDTNEEDATPSGNGDVADYPRGLYVAGSAELIVRWTGATAGARCYASAQVEERKLG